jgi:hypothetical protein
MKAGSNYVFVGTAYIHDLMNREAIEMMEEGLVKRDTVSII